MSDKKGNIGDMGNKLLKNPKLVPIATGTVGGLALLSGLFGRKEKTDENGEVHKQSILNWKTLLGGVLSVTAFTMIAKNNGFESDALKKITGKLNLGRGA